MGRWRGLTGIDKVWLEKNRPEQVRSRNRVGRSRRGRRLQNRRRLKDRRRLDQGARVGMRRGPVWGAGAETGAYRTGGAWIEEVRLH